LHSIAGITPTRRRRSSQIRYEGDMAADIADAERTLAVLDPQAATLVATEALARILLRADNSRVRTRVAFRPVE
jgi:hypothetical protein